MPEVLAIGVVLGAVAGAAARAVTGRSAKGRGSASGRSALSGAWAEAVRR
ncbi:Hypothetical protein RAK1035_2650 [Roseovarius sp. AK1035]|nr:Hypothetical protein RAK1035_2650 [Roseovarius sp. AK1035]